MTSKTKRTLQSLLLGSMLMACDSAIVISDDGKTELGYCSNLNTNISLYAGRLCPNGYSPLKNAEKIGDTTVLRCLSKVEEPKP